MTIYFIRHGEVDNPKQILYGRLPRFGLSELGKEQALVTAQKLKNTPTKALYTSPLLRARQTAEIIGSVLNLKPRIDHRLTEVATSLQGIPLVQFRIVEKTMYEYDRKGVDFGGETSRVIEKRMRSFVNSMRKKYQEQHIAAVSHGDPILILKSWHEKKDFTYGYKKEYMLGVGEIYEFRI